ncbi:NAD(P)-binding domain-containing protein [Pseudomonas segetis]
MHTIGILGVGELTEKVVRGLRRSGYPGAIRLSPRNQARAQALSDAFDCLIMAGNQAVIDSSDLLILGVRPDAVAQLAEEVTITPGKTLVSLVAGMKLDALASYFPGAQVVRAMLSYAAQINSTTVVIYPRNDLVQQYLAPLGTAVLLDEEEAFELATVAACMNGWFYFWLQDLQQWFVAQGMPEAQARQLVLSNMQDCLASAHHNPDADLAAMGNAIASPGTFTARGVELLRRHQMSRPWSAACDATLQWLTADTASNEDEAGSD